MHGSVWKLLLVQISVTVSQRHGDSDVPTLKLVIESLGVKLLGRDFDTSVSAYLGGIYVQHMLFKGQFHRSASVLSPNTDCISTILLTTPVTCMVFV